MHIEPEVGCSKRFRQRRKVDLPQPLAPIIAAVRPSVRKADTVDSDRLPIGFRERADFDEIGRYRCTLMIRAGVERRAIEANGQIKRA